MAKQWYILQVQSNYENRVQTLLQKSVQKQFPDGIGDVKIPQEDVVEVKNGKRRTIKRKFYPGYVLVELDMPREHEQWRLLVGAINRTSGVIGFVGTERTEKPRPLSANETKQILQRMGEIKGPDQVLPRADYDVGDKIKVVEGPFKDFEGEVEEVIHDKSKLKVHVEIFGRKTLVEVGFLQVEQL